LSDGTAVAWGSNTYGQLGTGTKTNTNIPIPVKAPNGVANLTNITDIKAGNEYSIALQKDGSVYTFGSNENLKLGNDYVTDSALPIKISGISGLSVSAGYNHSSIINNIGLVYTFGQGDYGQLGNNSYETTKNLQLVGLGGIKTNYQNITIKVGQTLNVNALSNTFNVIDDNNTPVSITYTANDANIVGVAPSANRSSGDRLKSGHGSNYCSRFNYKGYCNYKSNSYTK